jgi:hypothetical protein
MAEDTDAPADTEGEKEDEGQPEGDTADKWKALSRKHEREANALKAKVREYEEAGKSETERLTSHLKETEANLTQAETRALRAEVALDKGLPKGLATRLQGASREEMEADADDLLATLGDQPKRTPDLDGGARTPPPKGEDFNQQIRAALGRS